MLATFAVKRMAKEMGVDLGLVQGTGKHGRIHKEDVIKFKENPAAAAVKPAEKAPKEKKKGKKAPPAINQP